MAAGLRHAFRGAQLHAGGRAAQPVAGGVQPPHPEPGAVAGRPADRPQRLSDPAYRRGRALSRHRDRTDQPAGRGPRGYRRRAGAQSDPAGRAVCAGHHAAAGLVAAMGRRTGLQLHAADRQCARYGVGLHGGRHRPAGLLSPGSPALAAGSGALRLPDAGRRHHPALRVPIAGRVPRLGLAGHAASAGALADVFVQRLFRAPDPGRHRRRGAAAAWNAGVRVGDVGRAARSGGAGPGRGVAGGKLGGPGIRPCAAGQPRLGCRSGHAGLQAEGLHAAGREPAVAAHAEPAARPPRLKQTRVGLTLRRLRGNPPAARNTANPSRRG